MAGFRYRALDASGKSVTGVIDADTARLARTTLRAQGLFPQDVAAVRGETRSDGGRWRLSHGALCLLTRQLASLLAAGLTLEQALAAAHEQAEREATKHLVAAIRSDIVAGHALGDALARFPGTFPSIYLALVRAGERAGSLDHILDRLADHLETTQAARGQLLQALLYPAVVTLIAIAVIAGMMIYVVPQVVAVFRHGDRALPWLTQVLIFVSDGLRAALPWLCFGAVVGVVAAVRALRQPAVRARLDAALLRLPIIGPLLRTQGSARFAQTLAILVSGGVPLLAALDGARDVLWAAPLRHAVDRAIAQVREGTALAAALATTHAFPPLLVHLIGSGERSGRLDAMLDRAAQQQQSEVSQRTAVLVGLLEPALVVAMGGVVLLIVLAVLQPIIEINQLMR